MDINPKIEGNIVVISLKKTYGIKNKGKVFVKNMSDKQNYKGWVNNGPSRIIQKGEVLGLVKLHNLRNYIKEGLLGLFIAIKALDVRSVLTYLKKCNREELACMLSKWYPVFSQNTYDTRRTTEICDIKIIDNKPVKGYTPRRSPME